MKPKVKCCSAKNQIHFEAEISKCSSDLQSIYFFPLQFQTNLSDLEFLYIDLVITTTIAVLCKWDDNDILNLH